MWTAHAMARLSVSLNIFIDRAYEGSVYGAQVRLPEAATMHALLRKAEDWTQRAAAAAETERLPLKRLRDVLHAGTRMPVRFGGICFVDTERLAKLFLCPA